MVDGNADAANRLPNLLARLHDQEMRVAHDSPADIGQPGMDGHEVARRLRGRPEFVRTASVAPTGWGRQADRRPSEGAGSDHHLVKPVDPEAWQQRLVESRPTSRAGAGPSA